MYTYVWITQEFDLVGMPVRFYMRTLQNSFFFVGTYLEGSLLPGQTQKKMKLTLS